MSVQVRRLPAVGVCFYGAKDLELKLKSLHRPAVLTSHLASRINLYDHFPVAARKR
jgi:hypothetical protein